MSSSGLLETGEGNVGARTQMRNFILVLLWMKQLAILLESRLLVPNSCTVIAGYDGQHTIDQSRDLRSQGTPFSSVTMTCSDRKVGIVGKWTERCLVGERSWIVTARM